MPVVLWLNSLCQQIGVSAPPCIELIEGKATRWNLSETTCQQHRSAGGEQLITSRCTPQAARLIWCLEEPRWKRETLREGEKIFNSCTDTSVRWRIKTPTRLSVRHGVSLIDRRETNFPRGHAKLSTTLRSCFIYSFQIQSSSASLGLPPKPKSGLGLTSGVLM